MEVCGGTKAKDRNTTPNKKLTWRGTQETIPFVMQAYLTDQLADMQDLLTGLSHSLIACGRMLVRACLRACAVCVCVSRTCLATGRTGRRGCR